MLTVYGFMSLLGLVSVYLLFGCGATTNTPFTPTASKIPVLCSRTFISIHFTTKLFLPTQLFVRAL
jgi:hypothetical protein